jgi:flagellar biosynthesis protein FlhB
VNRLFGKRNNILRRSHRKTVAVHIVTTVRQTVTISMDFPIEYRDRMLAEQMAVMEALQFIVQILICFFLLVVFLILTVNLIDIVRTRHSDKKKYQDAKLDFIQESSDQMSHIIQARAIDK